MLKRNQRRARRYGEHEGRLVIGGDSRLDVPNDDTHSRFVEGVDHFDLFHKVVRRVGDVEFADFLVRAVL